MAFERVKYWQSMGFEGGKYWKNVGFEEGGRKTIFAKIWLLRGESLHV